MAALDDFYCCLLSGLFLLLAKWTWFVVALVGCLPLLGSRVRVSRARLQRHKQSKAASGWDRRHGTLRSQLSGLLLLLPAKYHPSRFFRHHGTTGSQIKEEFRSFLRWVDLYLVDRWGRSKRMDIFDHLLHRNVILNIF